MIFDPAEALAPPALRALQQERWQQLCSRLAGHRFHGPRLAGRADQRDLASVPFMRKQDLWDNYPFGLLAVDRSQVRRVHGTSGTKGRPTLASYAAEDLQLFGNVNARALAAAGAGPGTMVHNGYGYGLFTGGLGLHGGAEALGCCVVPISGGQTARQVRLIGDLRAQVICCTPSYAVLLGEAMQASGVSPAENPLQVGIFGAEPWTEEMRMRIESLHGITALDIYGMCEVIGPGVAFECLETRAELAEGGAGGMHVNEDHFFVEIVDPTSGDVLDDGQIGEVVFTTLTRVAQPVVRYRTGDLASLNRQPCACGRTTVRMSRLAGRSDDMLVVRGVNVFPSEIEAAILAMAELAPHYTIVLDDRGDMPEMIVACELAGRDVATSIHDVRAGLVRSLSERLGVRGTVVVGSPGTIPRSEVGKTVRVVRLDASSPPLPGELGALLAGVTAEASSATKSGTAAGEGRHS
ncbi:MAG: phenylacetate--CoA ligase family protein [Acidimicrobiales bacterium]